MKRKTIILIGIIVAILALNSCTASMACSDIYKAGKKQPPKQKSGVMTTSWDESKQ